MEEGSLDTAALAGRLKVDRTSRVPLATQISRQITWLIATGAIPPGARLPTLKGLADHLGVNFHTVRAAYLQLSADGLVAIRRGAGTVVLGYRRESALAGPDRQPSFAVGVFVPSFSDYYADYLDAITRAATVEGWLAIICQARHYTPAVVARYLDQLFSRNVDGVIVTHFETGDDTEVVETFRSSAQLRPLVFVDSADVGFGSQVTVDRETDGRIATRHLLEHGHTRVAYLAPPENWSATQRLQKGYRRALKEYGLAAEGDLTVHATEFSLDAGLKAAARLLDLDHPPSAVFCAGDILALGALSALTARGLRAPDDVAVMGYGELPFSALADPALASIVLPADDLAYAAVGTLRLAIDEGRDQPPVAVTTRLDPRTSCGCHLPLETPIETAGSSGLQERNDP